MIRWFLRPSGPRLPQVPRSLLRSLRLRALRHFLYCCNGLGQVTSDTHRALDQAYSAEKMTLCFCPYYLFHAYYRENQHLLPISPPSIYFIYYHYPSLLFTGSFTNFRYTCCSQHVTSIFHYLSLHLTNFIPVHVPVTFPNTSLAFPLIFYHQHHSRHKAQFIIPTDQRNQRFSSTAYCPFSTAYFPHPVTSFLFSYL
jgi:hypothetical protein